MMKLSWQTVILNKLLQGWSVFCFCGVKTLEVWNHKVRQVIRHSEKDKDKEKLDHLLGSEKKRMESSRERTFPVNKWYIQFKSYSEMLYFVTNTKISTTPSLDPRNIVQYHELGILELSLPPSDYAIFRHFA